jgi:Fur family transcriptional regulator, ferric uptake regulator
MRLTKYRKKILEVFSNNSEMLSAEDIYNKINEDKINLSTIYRSLETFSKEGLITKSVIDHTTYYYLVDHDHHHYMICIDCHKRYSIDCHLGELDKSIIFKK